MSRNCVPGIGIGIGFGIGIGIGIGFGFGFGFGARSPEPGWRTTSEGLRMSADAQQGLRVEMMFITHRSSRRWPHESKTDFQ